MNNFFDTDEREIDVFDINMDDAKKLDAGLQAGAGVLTAIGAVIVAIAGLVTLFSKDD